MADNKETDRKNELSADDVDLWREMTRDVDRLEGRDYAVGASLSKPQKDGIAAAVEKAEISYAPITPSHEKPKRGVDVDRNTMKRLKKGEMAIEGRLDLHGYNQGAARQALIQFILSAHASQKRCVLVVTGKGNTGRRSEDWLARKPGVLKANVPVWLREGELSEIVLQAVAAQPKDGGDGALYVYLRRNRA